MTPTSHADSALDAIGSGVPQTKRALAPWHDKYRLALFLTDLMMIVVALLTAEFIRFGAGAGAVTVGPAVFSYDAVGLFVELVWVVALGANESRSRRVVGAGLDEYRKVLNGTLAAFGTVAIISYLFQIELSRFYFVVAMPLGLALLFAGRLSWRIYLTSVRRAGRALTGAVVVGSRPDVARTLEDLRRHPEAGYQPLAVTLAEPEQVATLAGLPVVSRRVLRDLAKRPAIGAVIVTGGLPRTDIRLLAWEMEDTGTELMLVSQLTDVAGPRVHASPVQNLPLVHVDLPQYTGFNHLAKRVMDIMFSALALLILLPVFAAIAIAIKVDDKGPVVFRQERVGQNGATFTMHKFRSMAMDAEARLEELRRQNEGNGVLFKMKSDPRVTRVGAFLRKYSLDELPQFWDVLVGSMSVVGPRPPLATEVATYAEHVRRRLLTKPGVTGLWQVSGRSDLSWEESVRLDLSYVENWSITGDIVIILKTVRAVLRPSGAY